MIITCPSCSTRYRSPERAGESVFSCSCSRCEAVFSSDEGLVAGHPSPVLAVEARLHAEPSPSPVPPLPVPGPEATLADFPIGMDDPTLESRIRPPAPEVDEPPAVELPDFGLPEDPEAMFNAAVAECGPESDGAAEADDHESVRPAPSKPGFLAFLVVMLVPTGLAAGAWQLSLMYGEDPMTWTTPAGVLGLLFSWLWVRWKYRER